MGAAISCIRGPAQSAPDQQADCSLTGSLESGSASVQIALDSCRDKQPLTRDSVSSERAPCATEGLKQKATGSEADKQDAQLYCEAGLGVAAVGQAYDVRMSGPPAPGCDAERLATMQALHVLDAPPAAELDNILQLVCRIFNTENALIALFGDRRIYIRNTQGGFERGDFPWRYSFCGWIMASEQAQIMVVNDAGQDARFKDNKFVKEMGVRFYAGTPLLASNGHRLGTLCFADTSPRPEFDESSCQILNNFAELVTRELERDVVLAMVKAMVKAKAQQLEPAEQEYRMLLRGIDCFEASLLLVDTAQPGWPLLHANTSWGGLTGHNCLQDIGKPLWRMFRDASGRLVDVEALGSTLGKASRHVVRGLACCFCPGATFDLHFTRVNDTHVDDTFVPISVPTFTAGAAPPKRDLSTSYFFVRVEPAKAPGDGAGDAAPTVAPGAGVRAGSTTSSEPWRGDSATSLSSLRSLQRSLACQQLQGLELGVPIAAGSYGRVFKGTYQGETVAVKVLDSNAITRRDALTGLSLEVLLAERLRHPFIVNTKAWALVHGQGALPPREARVGESWSSGVHSNLGSDGQPLPADHPEQHQEQNGVAGPSEVTAAAEAEAGSSLSPTQAVPGGGGVWQQGSGSADSSQSSRCLLTPPLRLGSHGQATSEVSSGATLPGEGQTWLVMEYFDRGCLQDAVDRGWLQHPDGSVNLMAVIVTAYELACGLAHLHSLDIVHGDLSGFNVMLSSAGEHAADAGRGFSVRVGDFGLARDLGVLSKVETRTYGTITHMPPEVLAEGRLSKAADVYAFGVLLWQMLCGCRAWAGMSHAAVVRAVCHEKRHLEFPPDAPEGYVSLAQACMDHNAGARPTFADVLEVLQPLADMAKLAAGGDGSGGDNA